MADDRASWIAPNAQLTRVGSMLADFMPRLVRHKWSAGGWCWRIYGIKPHERLCLLNVTVFHGAWCFSALGVSVSNATYRKYTGAI